MCYNGRLISVKTEKLFASRVVLIAVTVKFTAIWNVTQSNWEGIRRSVGGNSYRNHSRKF